MKINQQILDDLYMDGEEGFAYLPRIKGIPITTKTPNLRKESDKSRLVEAEITDQFDNLREYAFTYEASRHEKWWLLDSLGPFYDEQWFDDVMRIVKGGKEASVYLCTANPTTDSELLAVKVYRPRSLRNLRKDHLYREGRSRLDENGLAIIDERQERAMKKRTSYGQSLMHTSWIEHEFRTLKLLHSAGCDVPTPYASDHNAILMDFIGDMNMGAPTLQGIHLELENSKRLFDRVIHNVDLMLDHERVHGDLSAYNILYWEGDITLIDFPQAINPKRNPNAYEIFKRDIQRICEYFISQGIQVNPAELSERMWRAHGYSSAPNILFEDEEEVY
jgi:RIO kinase 1